MPQWRQISITKSMWTCIHVHVCYILCSRANMHNVPPKFNTVWRAVYIQVHALGSIVWSCPAVDASSRKTSSVGYMYTLLELRLTRYVTHQLLNASHGTMLFSGARNRCKTISKAFMEQAPGDTDLKKWQIEGWRVTWFMIHSPTAVPHCCNSSALELVRVPRPHSEPHPAVGSSRFGSLSPDLPPPLWHWRHCYSPLALWR